MNAAHLYRMLVFASVVEQGSLTLAATQLEISRSMVSQHLKKLEQDCGESLLTRTTRSMELTEAGEHYYQYCAELLQIAKQVEHSANPAKGPLQGKITILVPSCYGESVLIPLMAQFNRHYPNVSFQLLFSEQADKLPKQGVDINISNHPTELTGYQSQTLHPYKDMIFASPKYIEQHSHVMHPDMLNDHLWICENHRHQPRQIQISNGDGEIFSIKQSPFISCNSQMASLQLTKQGLGLAILPDYILRDSVNTQALVAVLADHHQDTGKMYISYSSIGVRPPRITAFLEFLMTHSNG